MNNNWPYDEDRYGSKFQEHLAEYAELVGADYEYLFEKQPHISWNEATLSKIYCIIRFAYSLKLAEYDKMLWIDSDIIIRRPVDVFNDFSDGISIVYGDFLPLHYHQFDDFDRDKAEFYEQNNDSGCRIYYKVNSAMFLLDRKAARAIADEFFFSRLQDFHDENIIELAMPKLEKSFFPHVSNVGENKDTPFVHYCGIEAKKQLINLWSSK
jgi:hypothetical protein